MPKYQVTLYFTVSKVYEVEADNPDDALDKAHASEVDPIDVSGENFTDDRIEEI